jgi:exopolysaccharide biosynthesis polyprenyl glycosylphosphotransferase
MFVQRLRGLVNLHVGATTVVALALLLAYAGTVSYLPRIELSADLNLAPYLLCVALGMLVSARFVHDLASSFHRLNWAQAAWLASRQAALVGVVVFAFMFAFKDRAMSRLFMGSYLVLCWGTLILLNRGLPQMLSTLFFEQGRRIPTLFVGTQASRQRLRQWLDSKHVLGLQAVGFISLEGEPAAASEPPFLGGLADLGRQIEAQRVGQVILLEIPRTGVEGRHILETCQNQGCRLLIYSNLAEQFRHPLVTVNEEGHQFYTLQEEPLEDPFNRLLKRGYDIALALPVVVLVLPPLFVLVWLMQRLQAPGPVFHVQERTGYAKRRFRMLKFRSMYEVPPNQATEEKQASKGDPRVYPFGRFLRRSSLDEFPQFWNVLLGQMSAIGPRPHLTSHDDLFATQVSAYRTRFYAKPGITGLAQCSGYRGEITDPALLQRRIELDLQYIANWSIWTDIQITFRTLKQVVRPPKSAY